MTGVPGTVGRAEWSWPRSPGRERSYESWLDAVAIPQVVLRAIPFFALGLLASAHWAALVQPAPTGRVLVATVVATGGGVLISLSGRLPRAPGLVVRLLLVVATTLIAVAAIGIRFKLLMPAGWGTLGDRVSGGMASVGKVSEWPYAGPNLWLRMTAVLVAPIALALASALAFWPRRSSTGDDARALALALLVALYAVAVAARPFDGQGLRGLALLGCLAAWLWLPRVGRREAWAGVVAVAIAGAGAAVLMPPLASDHPWIDYHQWSWSLRSEKTISYDWRQRYGPLHWPRKDTTLLLIKSHEPEYWKAETLDDFDGVRWTTGPPASYVPDRELIHPQWIHTAQVTVRALSSPVVIAPGQILAVTGLSASPLLLANGAYLSSTKLGDGDTYTVRSYTPDPSIRQMRAAPPPEEYYSRYTTIDLPDSRGLVEAQVRVPLRGAPGTGTPDAATQLEGSRYARMYALARRIAAGAGSSYDVVRKIGSYLQTNYAYSERVPFHKLPLEAFLFQDRRGYCQQFSGAAALMLRMLGIPVRVASGFAPGTFDSSTHEYVVHDLDAHAWIEVWFQGLGWVPFDPTPSLAPAASQASFAPSEVAASAARGDARDRLPKKRLDALLGDYPSGHGAQLRLAPKRHAPWVWIALAAVALAVLVGAVVVSLLRLRARSQRGPGTCGDPDVDHLVRLLVRLGLEIRPGATLVELENRVARLGGAEAALYVREMRRRRFGTSHEPPPDRWDRRKLRLQLAAGTGAGPILRLRLAMPMIDAAHRRRGGAAGGVA